MEVPCWGAPLELLGTPPDVCGDCSPLDTLLGSGNRFVIRDLGICVFEMFGVFLPFRPDGIDILVIEVLRRSKSKLFISMQCAMIVKLWGCDAARAACCVFPSPASPVLEGWIS